MSRADVRIRPPKSSRSSSGENLSFRHYHYSEYLQQSLMSYQTPGQWPWAKFHLALHRPLRCPHTIRQRPLLHVSWHRRTILTAVTSGMNSECASTVSFDHFMSLPGIQLSTPILTRAADGFAMMRHSETLDTSPLTSKLFADE